MFGIDDALIGAVVGPAIGGMMSGIFGGKGAADQPSMQASRPAYPLTGGRGSDPVYDAFMNALTAMSPAANMLGKISYGGMPGFAKPVYDMGAVGILGKQADLARALLGSLLGSTTYESTGAQTGWVSPTAAGIAEGISKLPSTTWENMFGSGNDQPNRYTYNDWSQYGGYSPDYGL